MVENQLHYGDCLKVMQEEVPAESVDLVYADPPFNSNRDYNQIYNNTGKEDRAQVMAFTDTWEWDAIADDGYKQIVSGTNGHGLYYTPQCVSAIVGLMEVLGKGSMLAYLVYMAQRISEIWRVLKPTGSFYLHCDHYANAYLRMLLDSIFVAKGGEFRNEIIWSYRSTLKVPKYHFGRDHDTIFFYSKTKKSIFHPDRKDFPASASTIKQWSRYADKTGFVSNKYFAGSKSTIINTSDPTKGFNINQGIPRDVWDIPIITGRSKENLSLDTQKPLKLLERIIKTSSNEGDVVMDCFCGCGTTIEAAHRLNRKWIGIDISFNSIKIIFKRLDKHFGEGFSATIPLTGTPKDVDSARALSMRKDDPTRKEFEKWAILTYTNSRAAIQERKGRDKGIDGVARMSVSADSTCKILIQVKSGKVGVKDIRELWGVVESTGAVAGIFITLEEPTLEMEKFARSQGTFVNPLTGQSIECLKIVTIDAMLKGARMNLPMILEVF